MKPQFAQAIVALTPNAKFQVIGNDINQIDWQDENIKQPSDEAIQAKLKELQAEYDSKQYQRDRLKEYPDLQECIHAILDDDLTALQAKRKLVKEKYPKP